MPGAKSLLLFVSCWLLLATTILPSEASAAQNLPVSDAGTGVVETFPIMEDQVAVRQAHLTYLAAKEQIGMKATIRYIGTRGGFNGHAHIADAENTELSPCHQLGRI